MAELEDDLQAWLTPLITRLQSNERSKLARQVAQHLRRSQQKRILAQRNPDGSGYEPRKKRALRGKAGRIKRQARMFTKLRTARFLKARGNASAATIGFTGRISRIARVHQYGLRDRPGRCAPIIRYAQRELLGLTDLESEDIKGLLIRHLVTPSKH